MASYNRQCLQHSHNEILWLGFPDILSQNFIKIIESKCIMGYHLTCHRERLTTYLDLLISILELNLQVSSVIVESSLRSTALFQCHLQVLLYSSSSVLKVSHTPLLIGQLLTQGLTASLCLNNLWYSKLSN